MAEIHLSPEARERIADAVKAAEAGTSGEIVPIVVPASDRYVESQWACAALFAWIGIFFSMEQLGMRTSTEVLLAAAVLFGVGWLLGCVGIVKRLVTGRKILDREVQENAIQAFYTRRIDSTAKRTGMLIFLSLLEHRVVILADKGIDAQVPAGTWDAMVQNLVEEIRAGRWDTGLLKTIQACGDVLRQHFPSSGADSNELPDQLIEERDRS